MIFCFAFLVNAEINAQCTVTADASAVDVVCGEKISLSAAGSGILAFRTNFNCQAVDCPDPPNFGTWAQTSTAQFNNPCNPAHPNGNAHLWFNQNSASPRILATGGLNLSNGGSITFDMRMADPDFNGNASPCENPDSPDEGVYIQYSTDGTNWITIDYLSPNGGNDPVRTAWTTYSRNIPAATTNTRVRLAQLSNTGNVGNFLDHWGVEDVEIIANPPTATYTWSHTGVTKVADASTPDVTPTQTTTYTVTYNDGADVCTDDVTVNVTYPVITATTDKTSICPGEIVNLTADDNIGEVFVPCTTDNNTGCRTTPKVVTADIGGPKGDQQNNFSSHWGAQSRTGRNQNIYTAAELLSIGLKPGKITEVGMNILFIEDFSSSNANYAENFRIKMKCTSRANFSNSTPEGGTMQVYSRARQTFTTGWNMFTLDKAFIWDGKSNLVVEFCHYNSTGSGVFTELEVQTNTLSVARWISDDVNNNSSDYCNRSIQWDDTDRIIARFKFCEAFDPPFEYVWSPDDGSFNPNVNAQNPSASPPSTTTYTVKGKIAGAPDGCYRQDQVTINVADFSAFNPTATNPICVGDKLDFDAGLPGMASYTWTGPNGFNSNLEKPSITGVTTAASGTYTIVVANGNCSDSKTITVNVQTPPKAGSGTLQEVCTNSGPVDLNSLLTGADAGGSWADDDASGALSGSTFNPSLVNQATLPKTFNFTYTVTNPNCGSRSSTAQVRVYKEPVAGTGQTQTICATAGSVNLFNFLSGTFDNGNWADIDGSGGLTGNTFNPAGLGGNTYRFEHRVVGTAPCVDATTIVTLDVFKPSNPGLPRDTSLCSNSNPLDLFNQLDNQSFNGTWADDENTGILSGSTIDPSLVNKAALPDEYSFTHSITDLCGVHTSTVKVTFQEEPNAGNDKEISVCASASPVNLRTHLSPGFDTGGAWEDPDGSGQLTGSVFDPNGLGGNVYRFWYIVSAGAPCANDTATIKVTVTDNPKAGTGSTKTVCQGSGNIDLFTLLAGYDNGGVWVDTDNSNALSGSTFRVNNVNSNQLTRTFTFTYRIDDGCTVEEEPVTVTVQKAAQAGNDANRTLCASGGPVDLANFRSGVFETTGFWEDPGNSGALTGSTFDPTGRSGESHIIWYIVPGVSPCVPETAFFNLTVIDQPDAGEDANITLCLPINIDLFTQLGGNPDQGGTWQQTDNLSNPLTLTNGVLTAPDDQTVRTGIYTFKYTISASAPCNTVSANVTVEVRDRPRISDVVTTCTPDLTGYTVTFKVSGGDVSSYSVDYPGSFAADGVTYTTNSIPSNQTQIINVTDAWACASDKITVKKDCDCKTRVSSLETADTLISCGPGALSAVNLGGFVDDGDDVEAYYLHTGNANTLVGVIAESLTNSFSYDAATMSYGTVYYISAAAATAKANGYPDENDPCYQVAAGTPVVWFPKPSISSVTDKSVICPGEAVTFDITFGDMPFAPYTYKYSFGGNSFTKTNDGTLSDTSIVDNPLANTQYFVEFIRDSAGCEFRPGVTHSLDVNKSARADLTPATICSDQTPLELDIKVSGDGTSWKVVYTNDFNGNNVTVDNITAAGTKIPVSVLDSNAAVTYSLVSVEDNSGSICPGVQTGTYTINPAPSARIVNSDATYCQGTLLDFNFVLTGVGPWRIDLVDNLSNTYVVNANTRNYAAQVAHTLAAGSYDFTIAQVTDVTTGCTSPGSGKAARININQGPVAQVGFGLQEPLDANPNQSLVICDGSDATLDFQFVSGAGSNFALEYQHNANPTASLNLSVSNKSSITIPASDLAPGNHMVIIRKITDNSPAACASVNVDTAYIRVKALPQINITFNESDICLGTSATFNVDVTAEEDVQFDLFDQNGLVQQFNATATGGTQSFQVTPSAAGTYTYTVSNLVETTGSPACAGQYNLGHTLNVIDLPTGGITEPDIVLCQGTPVDLDYTTTGVPNLFVEFILTNDDDATTQNFSANTAGSADNLNLGSLPAGDYTLTMNQITDGSPAACTAVGSGALDIKIVAAPGLDNASFSVDPACFDEATSFDFQLIGNGPFKVTFDDGQGNVQNVNVPASGIYSYPFLASVSTTYAITRIEDATVTTDGNTGGCTSQNLPLSRDITVNPLPGLDFAGLSKICETESGSFSANAFGSAGDFTIEFRDALSGRNFTRNYTTTDVTIPVNLSMYNGLDSIEFHPTKITDKLTGCVGDVSNGRVSGHATLVIKPIPTDVFTADAFGGCAPFEPVLSFNPSNDYDSRVTTWKWTINGTQTVLDERDLALYLDKQGSENTVSLNYQTIHGCSKDDQRATLTVYPDPVAEFVFTPEEPSTLNYQVQFLEKTRGANTFLWYVEKDSILSSSRFVYDFPHDTEGFFEVCLMAVSNFGCVDSVCKPVYVKGVNLGYIPNAFTPDNDGINDVFKPVLSEIVAEGYSMRIFNRWGEVIYETTDPEQGWDGISNLGEEVPSGMYVYKIFAKTAFEHGTDINETGTITLMR